MGRVQWNLYKFGISVYGLPLDIFKFIFKNYRFWYTYLMVQHDYINL